MTSRVGFERDVEGVIFLWSLKNMLKIRVLTEPADSLSFTFRGAI